MTAVPVPEAASALGVRVGTVRRWIREGAPVVRTGRRGRGCAALVDPEAVQAWRQAGDRETAVLEVAAALPDVLANAAVEAWQQAQGIDKRQLAGVMAAGWYLSATAALDHLRAKHPAVPEIVAIPEQIERLRKIAGNRLILS
ncbi:hypothetical protein [Luteimonas sp. A501]